MYEHVLLSSLVQKKKKEAEAEDKQDQPFKI